MCRPDHLLDVQTCTETTRGSMVLGHVCTAPGLISLRPQLEDTHVSASDPGSCAQREGLVRTMQMNEGQKQADSWADSIPRVGTNQGHQHPAPATDCSFFQGSKRDQHHKLSWKCKPFPPVSSGWHCLGWRTADIGAHCRKLHSSPGSPGHPLTCHHPLNLVQGDDGSSVTGSIPAS